MPFWKKVTFYFFRQEAKSRNPTNSYFQFEAFVEDFTFCVFQTVDEEERNILNDGLLNYQRKKSDVRGGDLVDFLLINSNIEELPEESRQSRVRELSEYVSANLGNHFGHDILMPSNAPSRLQSAREHDHYNFPFLDNDGVEIESMEFMGDSLDALDLNAVSVGKAAALSGPLDQGDMKDVSESESDSELLSDSDFESASEPRNAPSSRPRISVGKFRAIMSKSRKSYQVESIIDDIKDDSGRFITLSEIENYRKRVDTLRGPSVPECFAEDNCDE